MIDHLKLGFANRTLGYRLPDKNRKAGADLRGRLQRLGIIRESGHKHFNGSVVIPIFDQMLGHADLSTIQIYTHVAIRQLQEIHRATTPVAGW